MTTKKLKTVRKKEVKKTVNLDTLVEKNKTTGTDFQAYMRKCIREGRIL